MRPAFDPAMNRRSFIESMGLCGMGVLAPRAFAFAAGDDRRDADTVARSLAPGRKPNVILVLCDDLGWGDIG